MATYKCKKPYMYGTGRRKSSVARVHIYKDAEHPHAAQKPEAWTLD